MEEGRGGPVALRSLDNALPATPERPKKIAKVAAPRPDIPRSGDDENAAPPPPSNAAAESPVEYVATCDLKPLADPETKINRLMEELDSKDWAKVCESLNDVRRLALHHSPLLQPMLPAVMTVMVRAMKNPRSALCKTSIMASTDVFRSFGHALLPTTLEKDPFDHLLLQLLLKASQDKKFVCEEAERSLYEMTCFLPPIPLLKKLQHYVKQANPKVRAKAAAAISISASKMDAGAMEEFGLLNLLRIASDLLTDRLPEARESSRNIVNAVYRSFRRTADQEKGECQSAAAAAASSYELWKEFCSSNLPAATAQSIAKTVLQ